MYGKVLRDKVSQALEINFKLYSKIDDRPIANTNMGKCLQLLRQGPGFIGLFFFYVFFMFENFHIKKSGLK